jgi:heme/copper-type cytochrome/quinol oxidase subunit 2
MYVGDPDKIWAGPALIITLAIVAVVVVTVLTLMLRRHRNRRALAEQGREESGPWWHGPNAPEEPPVPYRHREWD